MCVIRAHPSLGSAAHSACVGVGPAGSPPVIAGLRLFLIVWGVPTVVALVRLMFGRLRDAGYSAWYTLIACVPIVGGFLVIVALAKSSVEGPGAATV